MSGFCGTSERIFWTPHFGTPFSSGSSGSTSRRSQTLSLNRLDTYRNQKWPALRSFRNLLAAALRFLCKSCKKMFEYKLTEFIFCLHVVWSARLQRLHAHGAKNCRLTAAPLLNAQQGTVLQHVGWVWSLRKIKPNLAVQLSNLPEMMSLKIIFHLPLLHVWMQNASHLTKSFLQIVRVGLKTIQFHWCIMSYESQS